MSISSEPVPVPGTAATSSRGEAAERAASRTADALDADTLRWLCLEAGADDVGFVSVDSPDLDDEAAHARRVRPGVRTFVSFVVRMNREPIRSPARSLANLEFHHTGDAVDDTARRIVRALEARGVAAVNPSMGFPMEMQRFPGRIWVVSHKTVAVAAGLGHMGIHRNVIHPRFGDFVLLGTVLLDAEVSEHGAPLGDSPCLECRLCVSACPVGAIKRDGGFDFSACYTHNYKEFMGGFTSWVETVAESGSARGYRERVTDAESASTWQSLSYGANYKAAYCLAVCPAGEDVIGPWLADKRGHVERVVRPLLDERESVYVIAGSDAERHVAARFPHKTVRHVPNGLRPSSAAGFLRSLPLVFQSHAAGGLDATYHFSFEGDETCEGTVTIRDGRCESRSGLHGEADVQVRADAASWLRFVRKDAGLIGALLRRKVRVRGPLRLLQAFGRCFP